jgi:hypothetical protein
VWVQLGEGVGGHGTGQRRHVRRQRGAAKWGLGDPKAECLAGVVVGLLLMMLLFMLNLFICTNPSPMLPPSDGLGGRHSAPYRREIGDVYIWGTWRSMDMLAGAAAGKGGGGAAAALQVRWGCGGGWVGQGMYLQGRQVSIVPSMLTLQQHRLLMTPCLERMCCGTGNRGPCRVG